MLLKDIKGLAPLEKNTAEDKRMILSRAVQSFFNTGEDYHYTYLDDYDDSFVYLSAYDSEEGMHRYWKVAYTFSGVKATLAEEAVEVVRLTEWKEVSTNIDKSLSQKIAEGIEKYFGGSQAAKSQIIEKFNEEKMEAIEPLYIAIGDVDGVGDTYESPEVCHEMVKSFNEAVAAGKLSPNYFHAYNTNDFTILKAWVTECDCVIGETEVKEGQPLVKVKFNNEKAWELRKSGKLTGLSIGAVAEWEEIDEG